MAVEKAHAVVRESIAYKYSGVDTAALPWNAPLLEIKKQIEAVQGRYNYCLLNRYRSGADSMGWQPYLMLAILPAE